EISAYAPPSNRCRHNLNYWLFGDYLGIGAGAHGKLSSVQQTGMGVVRTTQPLHPRRYMETQETGLGQPEIRPVPAADLPFEFMLNALRLVEGFQLAHFERRTGLAAASVEGPVEAAIERGLMEAIDGPGWRPTPAGLRFLNDLQMTFLPDAA